MRDRKPLVVGVGGTTRPSSSSERALQASLSAAEAAGARVRLVGGADLARLPHYTPGPHLRTAEESAFVDALREADGVILSSPGYHGSVSGLLKNALDLLEETARDPRPYLDGVPVGLIGTAHGWQAATGAVTTLRSIVHALRGWPTPFGAVVNTTAAAFETDGGWDASVERQLALVGTQVTEFAARALR